MHTSESNSSISVDEGMILAQALKEPQPLQSNLCNTRSEDGRERLRVHPYPLPQRCLRIAPDDRVNNALPKPAFTHYHPQASRQVVEFYMEQAKAKLGSSADNH
ncbi:MAG: hypothetical protein SFT81_07465 [Candidatus Caenarcaniphilales bacterium]|nr:hypothetical protein [Candidatus Caenarcaniphilales bacterium]